MAENGSRRTICSLCFRGCGTIVHVENNRIQRVEGDPDHPANRGHLCPKAHAAKELVESPDRLTTPLRRTPSGLAPISWEDALDLAAEKLGSIRARYGSGSLVRSGGAAVNYEARDGFLHFTQRFGSSNFTGSSNCCWLPRAAAHLSVMGARPEPDLEHARMIVFWGANPVATERYGSYCCYGEAHHLVSRAKARGARVLAIDPVRSETAERAGEWLRIRPGTDAALGLAMIHVVIAEELYDRTFVDRYTVGFDELKRHVSGFTPDWAAAITGIDRDAIIALARSFATAGPVAVADGNGLDMYYNVFDSARTVALLLVLTGNVDVPGGVAFLPFIKQSTLSSPDKTVRLWHDQFPFFPRDVPFTAVKESLLREEPDRPRAMIVHHSNPVLIQANQKRTREALGKLEFILVDDIFLTATGEIADLVLPATSALERWSYFAYSSFRRGFVALGRPVVDPVGDSRDVFWMESEIARRMGLGADYPFGDSRTWVNHMLAPSGITFDRLEREQVVTGTPEPTPRKHESGRLATPSGKFELASRQLEKLGYDPLPRYREPTGAPLHASPQSAAGFPLRCSTRKPSQFVHTKLHNIRALTDSYPEPLLWMLPDDAAARGIAQGDMVELSSPRGRITVRTRFRSDLEPGLVLMDFGWGNPTDGLANVNLLTSDEYWNPVTGSSPQRLFPCDVAKPAA